MFPCSVNHLNTWVKQNQKINNRPCTHRKAQSIFLLESEWWTMRHWDEKRILTAKKGYVKTSVSLVDPLSLLYCIVLYSSIYTLLFVRVVFRRYHGHSASQWMNQTLVGSFQGRCEGLKVCQIMSGEGLKVCQVVSGEGLKVCQVVSGTRGPNRLLRVVFCQLQWLAPSLFQDLFITIFRAQVASVFPGNCQPICYSHRRNIALCLDSIIVEFCLVR